MGNLIMVYSNTCYSVYNMDTTTFSEVNSDVDQYHVSIT